MTAAAFKNTLISRFEESVMPVTESGCWLWLRGLDTTGYGVLKVVGRDEKAHRASWEMHNGPIPQGSKVLHRCDVRCCVNRELAAIHPIKKSMLSNIKLGKNWGGV